MNIENHAYNKCNLTLSIINNYFRSIINKRAEFLFFLQKRKPKIIILIGSETWLSNNVTDNEIIPNEFNNIIYRKGYGEVMIAVSKDILSSPVPELITSWLYDGKYKVV